MRLSSDRRAEGGLACNKAETSGLTNGLRMAEITRNTRRYGWLQPAQVGDAINITPVEMNPQGHAEVAVSYKVWRPQKVPHPFFYVMVWSFYLRDDIQDILPNSQSLDSYPSNDSLHL